MLSVMLDEQKVAQVKQLMDSDKWGVLQNIHCSEEEVQIHMLIQKELLHFQGHFPQQPVLAGVVQTHWACELGKMVFDIEAEFCGMENLKFLAVIQPERAVVLSLRFNKDKHSLKFSYYSDDTRFSEGRVLFSQAAE